MVITVHLQSDLITSTWSGNRVEELSTELQTSILDTIHACARRFPLTVNVFICERVIDVDDGHVISAVITRGNRRYVYVMERNYTVIFNICDVNATMIIPLIENNLAYHLLS